MSDACLMFMSVHVQVYVYVHTWACVTYLCLRVWGSCMCTLTSVHVCKGCLHICVSTHVCLYSFLCHVFWGSRPKKVCLTKNSVRLLMRAFLLWFGPIFNCCQSLGLQRERCVVSVRSLTRVYICILTVYEFVCKHVCAFLCVCSLSAAI